jgi:hypothetical protein
MKTLKRVPTQKITKKEKKSQKIDRLFRELKLVNDELDSCLFDNCSSIMSKEELMSFINKCKEKTKHLTGMEKIIKNSECKTSFFKKNKKFSQDFDEIMKCYYDKCSEKKNAYFDLTDELTELIPPNTNKKIGERIDKLFKRIDKCYFDKCENIFPHEQSYKILNKCKNDTKDNEELDKCLEKTNYNKKNEEQQQCREIKCKPVQDKVDPKIKLLIEKKQQTIIKKTDKLFKIAKEKYGITDRDF